jgi:glycosyltransferase involved in cell wall biosynthesis
MKVICLLPVRNEAWILESALENFSCFSDHIIVADQMSTDGSREIYKKFPKVIVIDNLESGHSNKVRWTLLDEARKIPGNNLIFCIDADEFIPVSFFESKNFEQMKNNLKPGDVIAFPWIQLWKSTAKYQNSGVWKNVTKKIAFLDDRLMKYNEKFVLNDHTNRIPESTDISSAVIQANVPLLHLQFVPWERTQMKQAWYRCSELVTGGKSARKINHQYASSLDTESPLFPVNPKWLVGIVLPNNIENLAPAEWHYTEIKNWFSKYGIKYFEPLQIWHISKLQTEFISKIGRKPRPKTYLSFIIKINNIKNYFKS